MTHHKSISDNSWHPAAITNPAHRKWLKWLLTEPVDGPQWPKVTTAVYCCSTNLAHSWSGIILFNKPHKINSARSPKINTPQIRSTWSALSPLSRIQNNHSNPVSPKDSLHSPEIPVDNRLNSECPGTLVPLKITQSQYTGVLCALVRHLKMETQIDLLYPVWYQDCSLDFIQSACLCLKHRSEFIFIF